MIDPVILKDCKQLLQYYLSCRSWWVLTGPNTDDSLPLYEKRHHITWKQNMVVLTALWNVAGCPVLLSHAWLFKPLSLFFFGVYKFNFPNLKHNCEANSRQILIEKHSYSYYGHFWLKQTLLSTLCSVRCLLNKYFCRGNWKGTQVHRSYLVHYTGYFCCRNNLTKLFNVKVGDSDWLC